MTVSAAVFVVILEPETVRRGESELMGKIRVESLGCRKGAE